MAPRIRRRLALAVLLSRRFLEGWVGKLSLFSCLFHSLLSFHPRRSSCPQITQIFADEKMAKAG
jgi:hypothetical protein